MPRRPGTIRQRPCLRVILLAVGEPSSLGDARCHRRRGAPRREALLVTKLLLAASPAFDRSLSRPEYRSRSPYARLVHGLSPGEHNFDPLDGDTHRWTTWNPPKYAAQRARPFARHYHTHATTIRGCSADRIAEAEAEALEDGKRAGGKNVYSVYAIRFTTPRPNKAKRFTSFA